MKLIKVKIQPHLKWINPGRVPVEIKQMVYEAKLSKKVIEIPVKYLDDLKDGTYVEMGKPFEPSSENKVEIEPKLEKETSKVMSDSKKEEQSKPKKKNTK